MIISRAAKLERNDIVEFSWFSLRSYHNTHFTKEQIINLHMVDRKQFKNAEKQAEQIKFFLLQAKEYFEASRMVTLVTRPVLLYYSLMCLATVEMLFKQSGDVSLDKARQNHRHHGLTFDNKNTKSDVRSAAVHNAAGLIAKPAMNGSARFGTFELWHRSARNTPLGGEFIEYDTKNQSQVQGFRAFAIPRDERMPLFPEGGLTLLEAIKGVPGMAPLLWQFGESPDLVRGSVSMQADAVSKQFTHIISIHPGDPSKIEAFFDGCKINASDWFHPDQEERYEFVELKSGGILKVSSKEKKVMRFTVPASTCEKFPAVHFFTSDKLECLNEFGLLYVALYMAGNYARYYPDYWIYDVENNTKLGLLIEHLLNVAEQRIALLTFSELARTFYIPA